MTPPTDATPEAADVPSVAAAPLPPLPLPFPPLRNLALGLRPWGNGATDAEALTRAWHDPDIARWTRVPPEPSEAFADRWIRAEGDRRGAGTSIDLVLTPFGEVDTVLGEVGLVVLDPTRRWAEVGYWLFPEARGAGRASAALGLLAGWALGDLGLQRLIAQVRPGNAASERVAEKAGFDLAGRLDDGVAVWVRDAG